MPIKKNFKTIQEMGNVEEVKPQEEILITKQEEEGIGASIAKFFSSVKTLLQEGAVFINENNEEETEEEKFLEDPYLQSKPLALHIIAFKMLPPDKADYFLNQISSIKMSENMELEIQMKTPNNEVKKIENIISKELKTYSLQLPDIMSERRKNLNLLFEAKPEIKKYLENRKNNNR